MRHRITATYRQGHIHDPAVLSTVQEIDALIDELLASPADQNLAQLFSLDRQLLPSGVPDHELMVGVDGSRRAGLLTFMDDGNWVTVGSPDHYRHEVAYYEIGHWRDFPDDAEIPVDLVRQAVKEFLVSGGQRPECVQWQVLPVCWLFLVHLVARTSSIAGRDRSRPSMRRAGVPLDETNRQQWDFIPFTTVGPLRFGMTHDEVVAALGGTRPSGQFGVWADFYEAAVMTYYGESGALCCVAADALHGPQVTMGDIRLTGRVPSEAAREFCEYAGSQDVRVSISQQGDPGADAFGLVLRAQRAGDVLLTRPVFVAREWADRVSDVSEGSVPQIEWSLH